MQLSIECTHLAYLAVDAHMNDCEINSGQAISMLCWNPG